MSMNAYGEEDMRLAQNDIGYAESSTTHRNKFELAILNARGCHQKIRA